ncbi:hypothetical protein BVC80_463g2 [Macleaya cordata]|uniref:Uncharacterized protein n=1 Tax=Macleaya cordata TaxID=56857 RepID=A0A200QAN0_MACCD|nr:hypothetical protein BVC80_463g2 [Macleaya cordata]
MAVQKHAFRALVRFAGMGRGRFRSSRFDIIYILRVLINRILSGVFMEKRYRRRENNNQLEVGPLTILTSPIILGWNN